MRTRLAHRPIRTLLGTTIGAALSVLFLAVPIAPSAAAADQPAQDDLTRYVDPFVGTAPAPSAHSGRNFDSGDVFPGAVAPNGMLAWSPDTTSAIPGGYAYADDTITGFSLTHFSGRGCAYKGDIPFMPVAGPVTASPGAGSPYDASFTHSAETATPGYYRVLLDSGVDVQLAATTRAGIGQFTFPAQPVSSVIINAGGSANGDSAAGVNIDPATRTVTGSATTTVGCGSERYTVYFAAQFDQPFSSYGTWNGASLQTGTTSADGSRSGAYLSFDTTSRPTVVSRVAVSYVSVAGAQANLAAEVPNWSFDTVRSETQAAWNTRLARIEVGGGTPSQLATLYTALYHLLIEPSIFNDVDGQYPGFDDAVHTVAPGHVQYSDITSWDGYRSFMPLFAVLFPQQASDVVSSMLNDAAQAGPGLPRWVQANRNSGGMVADDPDPYVASAYAFGARDFDTAAALHAMDVGASVPGTMSGDHGVREQLADWLQYHYVPGKAAISLEYATDDFSVAALARELGQTDLAGRYQVRAQYWQNSFNPATGFTQPKQSDGEFAPGFDPASSGGFVEGSAAQYTTMLPFDLSGLINAMGGAQAYVSYLDHLTAQLNGGPTSANLFAGNEPSEQTPWQYDYAGAPARTQGLLRRLQTQLYADTPGGLPGNDDAGALSSWYIWSVLGMYPETPGTTDLALGSPLFPHTVVHLGNGHTITIDAPGAAADAPYVQGLRVDGKGWAHAFLPGSALTTGATLSYDLGTTPNPDWATGPDASPPSYPQGGTIAIGYTPDPQVVVRPGATATLTIGAQNVTRAPQRVSWSVSTPGESGVSLAPSGGQLPVPPAGSATDVLTVTAGAHEGIYPVTFHRAGADGTSLPDVVTRVIVAAPGSIVPYFNNIAISSDSDPSCGDFSGYGTSYSADALAAAGLTPGGTVDVDGLSFRWPDVPPCSADNIIAGGQNVPVLPAPGATRFGVLGASANGSLSGPVLINYTDGTSSHPTLTLNAWQRGAGNSDVVVATTPYRNGGNGPAYGTTYIYETSVPVDPARSVASITLPNAGSGKSTMHIFAIALGS